MGYKETKTITSDGSKISTERRADFDVRFFGLQGVGNSKKRPFVVLPSSFQLVTVVPLSTKKPLKYESHHFEIPERCLPNKDYYRRSKVWLKGDMVYTVSYERLDPIHIGKDENGRRIYFNQPMEREVLKAIRSCVLHGLNLSRLTPYL